MQRIVHIERVYALAAKALAAGAAYQSRSVIAWELAGRCQSPRSVSVIGRPDRQHNIVYASWRWSPQIGERKGHEWRSGLRHALEVRMEVPCRECGDCLRSRARQWRVRMARECELSQRTWFGTLTLSPDRHMHWLSVARAKATQRGYDLDADSPYGQATSIAAALYRAWQLGAKRLRKSGFRLRYVMVVETHKSGVPHLHVLVHEQVGSAQITWRVLSALWAEGFSTWKLADATSATYVCKYLSKSVLGRVRASTRYGENHLPSKGSENVKENAPQKVRGSNATCLLPSSSLLKDCADGNVRKYTEASTKTGEAACQAETSCPKALSYAEAYCAAKAGAEAATFSAEALRAPESAVQSVKSASEAKWLAPWSAGTRGRKRTDQGR